MPEFIDDLDNALPVVSTTTIPMTRDELLSACLELNRRVQNTRFGVSNTEKMLVRGITSVLIESEANLNNLLAWLRAEL